MRLLLALFIAKLSLLACATCLIMTPTVSVELDLELEGNHLKNIKTHWHFSDLYTTEIKTQYDKNQNDILEPQEFKAILDAKLSYLIPKEMLFRVSVGEDNTTKITPEFENFHIGLKEERLYFRYDAKLSLDIEDHTLLSLLFEDDEGFFSFIIDKINIPKEELHYEQNLYLFSAFVRFSSLPIVQKSETNTTQPPSIKAQEAPNTSQQATLLNESITKIKALFVDIKENQTPLSYALLLFFAFIYGVIHAIGPGHGKSLVASYFLSNDKEIFKALLISLAIGVVHTFSAFFLTLFIYLVVEGFLAQFLDNTIAVTTKISALIIIAIALYLFFKKIQLAKKSKRESTNMRFFTTPHESSCGCGSCKIDKNSTDIALIISAGIIPCPGTVTLFLFSLSLGLYTLGFLSAFVMSLGMSSIIFLSALFATILRKKTTQKSHKIKIALEYVSLLLIFSLGIALLLS